LPTFFRKIDFKMLFNFFIQSNIVHNYLRKSKKTKRSVLTLMPFQT
jgi:hypothetical protein